MHVCSEYLTFQSFSILIPAFYTDVLLEKRDRAVSLLSERSTKSVDKIRLDSNWECLVHIFDAFKEAGVSLEAAL